MNEKLLVISEAISEGMYLAKALSESEDKALEKVFSNASKGIFPRFGQVFPVLVTKNTEKVKQMKLKWADLYGLVNGELKKSISKAKGLKKKIRDAKNKESASKLKEEFSKVRDELVKAYKEKFLPIIKDLKNLRKEVIKELKDDPNLAEIKKELKRIDEVANKLKSAFAAKTLFDKVVEKVVEWFKKAIALFTDKEKAYLQLGVGSLVAVGAYLIMYGIAKKLDPSAASFNPFKLVLWAIKVIFTSRVKATVGATLLVLVIIFVLGVAVAGKAAFTKIKSWFDKKKGSSNSSETKNENNKNEKTKKS